MEVEDTLGAIFYENAAMAVYVMIKAEKSYSTSKNERPQESDGGDEMWKALGFITEKAYYQIKGGLLTVFVLCNRSRKVGSAKTRTGLRQLRFVPLRDLQ